MARRIVAYPHSVARDIIDDRMIGALHLRALSHAGLEHDPIVEHVAVQTGTLDALMAGGYEGDTTLAELIAIGDHGIGTVQSLDGELIVLDGRAWAARHDGRVDELDLATLTPFAVVTRFAPTVELHIDAPTSWAAMRDLIDSATTDAPIVAIRADGDFTDLRLRSVAAQEPPYPPLRDVVEHQTTWEVPSASGSVFGFRFPDASAGVEVPGHHLHFLSDDRTIGGHVMSLTVERARVRLDAERELHVELPPGVTLGVPGAADRAEIDRLEGGR